MGERADLRDQQESELRESELMDQMRARIATEPAEGAADRRLLMFRLPGGVTKKRAFLGSTLVRELYDYIDVETSEEEWNAKPYTLITTMPKRSFTEREKSLAE